MEDKVSFYIPAFNAEKTISKALDSIFNQSIDIDEILVIDDFSNDKTNEIVKKYKNVKLIKNLKNMGLGYSRNLAIKECKNKIIGSIDSDVVLDKEWTSILLNKLKKDQIVICGGKMIEKITNTPANKWRSVYYSQNWGDFDNPNPPFLFGCNTLQFKTIWEEVGGYDQDLKTNGEDINFCSKISKLNKYKTYYSSSAICYHLQDDDINSLSKRVWRYHSFGYKIKKPSLFKLIKLTIKQFKIFIKRIFSNILNFEFIFIYISLVVFFNFVKLEYNNFKNSKK